MIKIDKSSIGRVSQGDIYKDVEYIESIIENAGNLEISKIIFPFVIVLTQDCDLLQDYTFRYDSNKTDDKVLVSILVAPLYNAANVYEGTHLSELNRTMRTITVYSKKGKISTEANNLFNNEIPRYHYLEFEHGVNMVPSIIDFKHYFTVNANYLHSIQKQNFVCRVSDLFREDISQRFSSYLSRIGLPVVSCEE